MYCHEAVEGIYVTLVVKKAWLEMVLISLQTRVKH